MPDRKRIGPADNGTDPQSSVVTASDVVSVPQTVDITWPDTGLDLVAMTDHERRCWEAGYFRGHVHGIERGRELAEADMDAAWSGMVRHVQATLRQPSYAELCRRRNEPERLERALEHERRLGLAS